MPEVSISSGSSPPSALPQYPSHRQLADLGTRMSAAFSGLSSSELPNEARQKPASVLNPHAASFQPGVAQGEASRPSQAATARQARSQAASKGPVADGLSVPASMQKPEVVVGFASPSDVNMSSDTDVQQVFGTGSDLSSLAEGLQKATSMFNRVPSGLSGAIAGEKADKAVARRLLLKKRTPSFSKSKSCNDLVAAEPKSPTRSPFAPLAHLAQ